MNVFSHRIETEVKTETEIDDKSFVPSENNDNVETLDNYVDKPENEKGLEFSSEKAKVLCDDYGNEVTDQEGNLLPNTTYTLFGIEYETDDNGEIFSIDGEYLSNIVFYIDGKEYRTDDNGYIYSSDDEFDYDNLQQEQQPEVGDLREPYNTYMQNGVFESVDEMCNALALNEYDVYYTPDDFEDDFEVEWSPNETTIEAEDTNQDKDFIETDENLTDEIRKRDLTEDEKQRLLDAGMSESNVDKCKIGEDGVIYLETENQNLEGREHPITGVKYVRAQIDLDGMTVEGVFPEFDSVFDCELPEDLLKASDLKQFEECMTQLKEAIEKDPELAAKFTPQQLERIMDGKPPRIPGYTWHHNEVTGKMQLVKVEDHQRSGHTGGQTIWGGGQENRK